jgi:hypothetical protein
MAGRRYPDIDPFVDFVEDPSLVAMLQCQMRITESWAFKNEQYILDVVNG